MSAEKQESEVGTSPSTKTVPHGYDVYKEDLEGELWWLKDNDFLLRGYRTQLSFTETVKSLFIGHNETMNVWTHVVGVCFVIGLAVLLFSFPLNKFFKVDAEYATYNSLFEAIAADWNSDVVPRWPILVFLYGAYFCLRGSSVYHGFYCISFIVENIVQTIDYCGVTINVLGSYIPILYYSFYCYPEYRKLHLTITIILNLINLSIMATPKYRAPETRPIRAISYICVSCYIFIAMIHLYTLDGFNNPFFEYSIKYIFLMAASYLSGACCYVLRIPERFAPGKFDYVLASHQLFHVFIVFGMFFHFVAVYQLFISRVNTPCILH